MEHTRAGTPCWNTDPPRLLACGLGCGLGHGLGRGRETRSTGLSALRHTAVRALKHGQLCCVAPRYVWSTRNKVVQDRQARRLRRAPLSCDTLRGEALACHRAGALGKRVSVCCRRAVRPSSCASCAVRAEPHWSFAQKRAGLSSRIPLPVMLPALEALLLFISSSPIHLSLHRVNQERTPCAGCHVYIDTLAYCQRPDRLEATPETV